MSLPKIKTLQSFGNRNFRTYFIGMAGQWAAMSMQAVVQSLLVYRITGSAAILGILALASGIPQVLFCLLAGAMADRFPKKYMLQMAQAATAATSLLVAICLMTGYISEANPGSWWILLVTSIIQGAMNALMMTARAALIPELVGTDLVLNATSLNSMGMQIFQFVAPSLAGVLIDVSGFSFVYFLMAGLCIIAIVLTNFLPTTHSSETSGNHNMIADIVEGLKYARSDSSILLIVAFTMMCVVISLPLTTLLSVFADSILKVGATGLGLLQGMMSIGSFLVALVLASMPPKKRGIIMLCCGLCLGVAQMLFAFSNIWVLSLILAIFIGIGRSGHYMPATTMLQSYTDKAYLGRVLSILNLSTGFGSLATFLVGVLTEAVGVQWAVGGTAMVLVISTGLIFLLVPRIRKMD